MSGKIVWAWTALLVSVLFLSPMSAVAVLRAWATDPLSPPPLARVVVAPVVARIEAVPESVLPSRVAVPAAAPTRHAGETRSSTSAAPRIRRSDRLPVARPVRSVPSRAPPA